MIIVSQNKEEIVNFDNVINIGIQDQTYNHDSRDAGTEIDPLLTCSFTKSIIAWFSNNKSIILGNYLSLDRAKEVLKNIVEFYSLADKTGCVQPLEALALAKVREHSIIYMPEK